MLLAAEIWQLCVGVGRDEVEGSKDRFARDAANTRGASATRGGNRRNVSPAR